MVGSRNAPKKLRFEGDLAEGNREAAHKRVLPRDHGRAGRASLPGSGLRSMEKLEICPYHPLGLEKYAKFGKKVLYDNPHPASKEDVARWERKLHFDVCASRQSRMDMP